MYDRVHQTKPCANSDSLINVGDEVEGPLDEVHPVRELGVDHGDVGQGQGSKNRYDSRFFRIFFS